MLGTLQAIFAIAGVVGQAVPGIVATVKNAIAAYEANDQASLDAAHQEAIALAQPYAPEGVVFA